LTEEYATTIAGDIELSSEFELFLKRRLTPEQRLSGLKTTEAAEFTKLMRLGEDAYLAEKQAELDPIMDAFVAKERHDIKAKKENTRPPNLAIRPTDVPSVHVYEDWLHNVSAVTA
jgi:hypothetical protein